jgi:hypothetical protein
MEVFDHCCTLDREVWIFYLHNEFSKAENIKVNLIWKKGIKSLSTVLFLANRYMPYIYVLSAIDRE